MDDATKDNVSTVVERSRPSSQDQGPDTSSRGNRFDQETEESDGGRCRVVDVIKHEERLETGEVLPEDLCDSADLSPRET